MLFLFRLAGHLKKTVGELAADMGWQVDPQSLLFDVIKNELLYWMEFAQLEPFGSAVIDRAHLQSAIWSTGCNKYFPPSDFLPILAPKIDPDSPEQIEKDWANAKLIFAANGI